MDVDGEDLGSLENYEQHAAEPWVRGWRLEDRRYVRCRATNVKLLEPGPVSDERTYPERFEDRPRMRRVSFVRCTIEDRTWTARSAVLEEVAISDVRTEIKLELCALRHVTLEGRLGKVYVNWSSGSTSARAKPGFGGVAERRRVDDQNDRYHEGVDWMLDISRARFPDGGIRNVPTDKVVIDPDRHAFVSAASLEPGRAWIEAMDPDEPLAFLLGRVLAGKDDTGPTFFFVPHGDKRAAGWQACLARLHAAGLTLPTAPAPELSG